MGLDGIEQARRELKRYSTPNISIVTWMEVMVGAQDRAQENTLRAFLSTFEVISLTEAIAERSVMLRRKRRVRLPDAIIWASAQTLQCLLVTRNSNDFPSDDPGIRCPYPLPA